MDVELEAGLGVKARQVNLARGHLKMTMDEVHQSVRQVGGKIGAEVRRAVFFQAAGDVHPRIFLVSELDVWIRLVVA